MSFGVVRTKLATVLRRVYPYNVSTRSTEAQPLYNTLSAVKLVHFTNILLFPSEPVVACEARRYTSGCVNKRLYHNTGGFLLNDKHHPDQRLVGQPTDPGC